MPSIGIADKITLDQVKALIGAASPASGDLTTLFKSLKLISDYVDTLEAKIGLNTDAAGSTTLFARLAQIAGYVDTVESALSTIAGYTDTVESVLSTISGNINGLGSSLAAGVTIGRTGTLGSYITTSADLQTALNLSGKGSLVLVLFNTQTGQLTARVKITIDGIVISDSNVLSGPGSFILSPYGATAIPTYLYTMNGISNSTTSANPIDFKTSLKIEVNSDGTRPVKVLWMYNI